MKKRILITGGTGLLGSLLTEDLQSQGHKVSILSRNPSHVKNVDAFYWDVDKGEIDTKCLDGVDVIIHLAGEGIADKRWTATRKQSLIDSRVKSIQLLYQAMSAGATTATTIISASAVGYYGDRGDAILAENSARGAGFLAELCEQWEEAVDHGFELGLRVVKFRIGLLLTKKGGVLQPFKTMVSGFTAMKFGDGQQWHSWIHAEDMIRMFSWAMEQKTVKGAFNATAPTPVKNKEMIKTIATILKKPFWPLTIPAILFNLLLGKRSELLLASNRTSSLKVQDAGFVFKHPFLENALRSLLIPSDHDR